MAPAFPALAKATKRQPKLPIWISHMWQRIHEHKKLGVILGAGATVDAGCPPWSGLVKGLTSRSGRIGAAMRAHRRARLGETYLTQIVFMTHRERSTRRSAKTPNKFRVYYVNATWMELVHNELYRRNKDVDITVLLKKHRYLEVLGEFVCRAGFAINFNFDGLVDEAATLFAAKRRQELPEIIWRPKTETRRDAPVIYHVNGYLPREARRPRSDFLTFTEDAFADVLLSSDSASTEFIESRFANTTFLLLGTSLNDNSLKNMLRSGMKRSPANHHYIIYWENPARPRLPEEQEQIFNVNLEVYNLISIFLGTDGIVEILTLLNETGASALETHLREFWKGETCRRYYLVGAVSSGKTTSLEMLRCFTTFEEWSGIVPITMYQDHRLLNRQQRSDINKWLYSQLKDKNRKMSKAGPGIVVMDRAYLDLFAFSETPSENISKATDLLKEFEDGGQPLAKGQVVFLKANKSTFEERRARRGKVRGHKLDYRGGSLIAQSNTLEKIYRPKDFAIFDTGEEPADATARTIARLMLLEDYSPLNFEKRINQIISKGGRS